MNIFVNSFINLNQRLNPYNFFFFLKKGGVLYEF
jgi:hypothetical protein